MTIEKTCSTSRTVISISITSHVRDPYISTSVIQITCTVCLMAQEHAIQVTPQYKLQSYTGTGPFIGIVIHATATTNS